MAQLKIASVEEKLNDGAVSLIEDALAVARDPAEKVEGAALVLFRADRTFATWWSPQSSTAEKIGFLEVLKNQLINAL